jgi:hypothetical protein
MNTLNRDYDDVLRRALHAAAESVDPSPDGLERIRARMGQPPVLSLASAVAWCHEAGTMALAWAAPLIRTALDAFWSVIDRFRPATAVPGQSGPRYGWIRPVVAMGTAIFIVAAGAFAVLTLPHAMSSDGNSAFFQLPWTHPAGSGGSGSGGNGSGLNGQSSSQIAGGSSAAGTYGSPSSASPASSQCSSLGSSRTGTQSSAPPILTPSSTAPASSSPPVSSTPPTVPTSPATTLTPTATPTTSPDPGSANTPIPTTSSQASSAAAVAGRESTSNPREAAIVPSTSVSAAPTGPPCQTSPAKKKKTKGPAASTSVSAYGALQFRITQDAAKRD